MQNPGMILTAVMATFVAATWTTGPTADWPPDPRNTLNLAGSHTFKVKFTLPLDEIARAKQSQQDSPRPWTAEWQTDWKEQIVTLFRVPKDRWLVVTDYHGPSLYERWGKVIRLKSVELTSLQSFRAGLVFAPGTEVVARVTELQYDRRAVIEPGVEHQNLHDEWQESFGYMLLGYLVAR